MLADHEDIAQWKPELPMIRDLDWKLGWADSDRDRYADFRVKLNDKQFLFEGGSCSRAISPLDKMG